MRRGNRRAQTCDRGATESLPAEAPAECGSCPSRQRDPGAAGRATSPPLPRPTEAPLGTTHLHKRRRGSPGAQGAPLGGASGAGPHEEGGAPGRAGQKSEGGAPNGATARLFGELQGCGAGLRRGGGATDSAPPRSVSGTHLWVGGSYKALSHARWAASAEPLPPASGHTNSQALAAEQPLFSLLVNQAKECFLRRAVLVQLDLDLHRQGLWLVPALYGWSRRF